MKTHSRFLLTRRLTRLVFCLPALAAALAQAAPESGSQAAARTVLPAGELRLQFRGAPLERVLTYLSEAAGLIVVPETEIKGTVDVWSPQPVTRTEAIELLNGALGKQGYALLLHGRTLSVVNREQARRREVPVQRGNNPGLIPSTDTMVTQVIPVRYLDPAQLLKNLQPLLAAPEGLTASAEGNALVLTDTQRQVRRMVEIIRALDTACVSACSVKVFPLKHADAKATASLVNELFQPDASASGGGTQSSAARLVNFLRDAGAVAGDPGGSESAGGNGRGIERSAAARAVAVADERSNSLLVSAPEGQMPIIARLVKELDVEVRDITELRVFHLKNADAQETADLLSSLFSESGDAPNGNRGQVPAFGPEAGGDATSGGGQAGGQSGRPGQGATARADARWQPAQQVLAVPDPRTRSVVVTAALRLMPRIASLIRELDANPANTQKLFVFSVEHSDPQAAADMIERLFPNQNSSGGSSSTQGNASQSGTQLNNRAATMQNQTSTAGSQGGLGTGGTGAAPRTQ